MPPPADWSVTYIRGNSNVAAGVSQVAAVCPWCGRATTFSVRSVYIRPNLNNVLDVHLVIGCSYTRCLKDSYVYTTTRPGHMSESPHDQFYMFPSKVNGPAHPSIPENIAEDWLEGLRAFNANAPKAAAVMFRRVLYGVLIDKGCPLHPMRTGVRQLLTEQRLPAMFDRWIPAIQEDGHDAAHPDRALIIDPANIAETMEYTSELLRYLYIEPAEFEERTRRASSQTASS